ncbi:hypothetical protein [Neorhizobium sp. LjRoot104]|uniref:hypothetical protein n=1 Tax=Neorhizobium sp. LjRoot104 TaxID=3342254 RepID=UPI003ED084AB
MKKNAAPSMPGWRRLLLFGSTPEKGQLQPFSICEGLAANVLQFLGDSSDSTEMA